MPYNVIPNRKIGAPVQEPETDRISTIMYR
ncbi:uncharacterized protein METZ01_LOCUS508462 [marine metagenome]|uniref:Uncharacterized protein n=1 Tax=marine metagenome TaxID=408172 RepID=A0A383EHM8_9ZZZZ